MMLFSTVGKVSVSEPFPVPPTIMPLVFMSLKVVIPVRRIEAQTLTSLLVEPSQPNLRGSNLACLLPNRGSMGMPRPMVDMAVPSWGITLYMSLARIMLPAPGLFLATNFGLPGIWRPMCRANVRA